MSPRSKKQFDEMKEQSRKAIMKAAMELFTNRGYHGTSVSMIAKQAEVSTGLMYNYFRSKVELLEAIVQEGLSSIERPIADIGRIEDPRSKITSAIQIFVEMADQDPHFWGLYFSIIMQPDLPKEAKNIFTNFAEDMFVWFGDIFTQLNYADPKTEARILAALIDGVILHYWLVGERYPVENVKKMIVDKYSGQE